MALFSTSFFAKCLRVGEDGPWRGHLCHTNTFLVSPLEHIGRMLLMSYVYEEVRKKINTF